MKKYDLIIVGMYLLVMIVVLSVNIAYAKNKYQAVQECREKLQKIIYKPLRTLVIKNANRQIFIVRCSNLTPGDGCRFSGCISCEETECFQLKEDTLFIRDYKKVPMSRLDIQIAPEVKVDTLHAPNVTIK